MTAGRKLKAQGFSFDIAFTSVLTRVLRTLGITLAEMGLTDTGPSVLRRIWA